MFTKFKHDLFSFQLLLSSGTDPNRKSHLSEYGMLIRIILIRIMLILVNPDYVNPGILIFETCFYVDLC